MYFKKDRAIHLVVGMTDMRKQINGLARLANEHVTVDINLPVLV